MSNVLFLLDSTTYTVVRKSGDKDVTNFAEPTWNMQLRTNDTR